MKEYDLSIVISTYNRCELLPGLLEAVFAQEPGSVNYEVILVDNNSTDDTRKVVESFIAKGHANLRYIFEGRQGVSYGRNAGIAAARAPVLAFLDDDVRPPRGWVRAVKRALDDYPGADFVGGKVLPKWRQPPPAWLSREHWSPLALVDYGESPLVFDSSRRLCLLSANLAVRRRLFDRVGLFSTELQRVKDSIGSMEDLVLQLRAWNEGRHGVYSPDLVIKADVPADRLLKSYHRRWHKGHGHFYALLRLPEMERSSKRALFGVPVHLYKQALVDLIGWMKWRLLRDSEEAFKYEARLMFFVGFFATRRKEFAASERRGTLKELLAFLYSRIVAQKTGKV